MTHPRYDLERRGLPVEAWPLPDQAAWNVATARYNPIEPLVGLADRWSPATRRLARDGYGRWLGWLGLQGDLDTACAPGARVTRDRARAYLAMMRGRDYAPYTISGRFQQLADAMRVMEPTDDWSWLRRGAARLHGEARPVRDLASCLRPAEDLVQLGFELMEEAEHDRGRAVVDRAAMFRDGLAVAALVHRPLRIKNFAAIKICQHLGRADEGWTLAFVPEEMKTQRRFECGWPDELVTPLNRYLQHHREVLIDCKRGGTERNDNLWVSIGGAGMTPVFLGNRITKRTGDAFGAAITPHVFRHVAATTIATDDPEGVTGVPTVLGHATLATSEKHYNLARMINAGARYHVTLEAIRGRGAETS
jgi:integrase/recombinase XerD